ncbi:MAG: glycerol kinase GlpK [Anaerolineaceae bacterium]|nr:glycerol kinase GlpK [Anaerolineaceae bacterium]
MSDYVLALDQGTTSSRAILFDRAGSISAVAQREFPQLYPQPGWVEHEPLAIWLSQLTVAREALAQAGADATQLAAIGITNQRETTLLWERDSGRPLNNAIVWQDRRTAHFCDELKAEGFDQVILEHTGLVTDPYFSGTKLHWLLEHVPGARPRAERGELAFGTVDTWLIWQLTGGRLHVTDVSNASRTMLYDIHAQDWCGPILERLNIPRGLLPCVTASSVLLGESDAVHLGARVLLAGMAGDQQAATFGQACHSPGMAKNTYGTGCFLLLNTGETPVRSANNLLTTLAWRVGDAAPVYALEGSVFVAGAAVQWLRDELGLIASAEESAALAASVRDSGGVVVVPAFTGLGAPWWDAYARGAVLGLTRGSGRAEIVRATLESIAFQSRDVVDAMSADAGLALRTLRVDGGAAANDFLMQFQADILGTPVQRPAITETTALGAAYLAGLASAFWNSSDEIAGQWRVERVFEPRMSVDERETRYAAWGQAVGRVRGRVEE